MSLGLCLALALLARPDQEPLPAPTSGVPATLPEDPHRAAPGGGTGAPVQDTPPPVTPPPATQERIEPRPDANAPALTWDGTPPADAAACADLLARFAQAYPQSFHSESLGAPAPGQALWLATVTRAPAEQRAGLPALLFAPPSLAPEDAGEVNASLLGCAALLEGASREGALSELLAHSVVHWIFWLRPERAFSATPATALELDFPAGWQLSAASRPFPLFDAQTRAVADFLLKHPGIALCCWSNATPPKPEGLVPYAFERCAPLTAPAGSLERFVHTYLGAAGTRSFRLAGTPPEARAQAGAALELLLRALPHLTAELVRSERLQPDLWSFELRLSNNGQVGTLEGPPAERERSSVRATLSGAELSAAALAAGAEAVFEPLGARAATLQLGHLAGGEVRVLRLLVRGSEGASARLELSSLRAGAQSVLLELK